MGNKAATLDDMLTEEELAALSDDDAGDNPGDNPGDAALAEGDEATAAAEPDEGEEGSDAGETPDPAASADKPDPAAEAAATAAADTQPAAEPDPAGDEQPAASSASDDDAVASVPPMTWALPADHKDKIESVEKSLDELAQKFDDGELLATEYRQQSRALQNQLDEMKKLRDRAENKEADARESWMDACDKFLAENKHFSTPGPLRQMLDAEVRRIQEHLGQNGRNYMHASVLDLAAENVKRSAAALLGVQINTDDVGKGRQKQNAAPAPKAPAAAVKPREAQPVPTLSAVPVDAEDDIESGEFAYLNRLADKDWPAYERELEKLQRTDQDKYNAYMAYVN